MESLLRKSLRRIVRHVKDRRRYLPRNPGVLAAERLPRDKTADAPAASVPSDPAAFYDALGVRAFEPLSVPGRPSADDDSTKITSVAKQFRRSSTDDDSTEIASVAKQFRRPSADDDSTKIASVAKQYKRPSAEDHAFQTSASVANHSVPIVQSIERPKPKDTLDTQAHGQTQDMHAMVTEALHSLGLGPDAALPVRPQTPRRPRGPPSAAETFGALLRETGSLDAAIGALEHRRTAVQPTTALANEAVYGLAAMRRCEDAFALARSMHTKLGVPPDSGTAEALAYARILTGSLEAGVATLEAVPLPFSGSAAPAVYNAALLSLRRRGQSARALALFEGACARAAVAPPAVVAGTALEMLAVEDCVERAFAVYARLAGAPPAKRLAPNAPCHAALISAAVRRKEYFGRALALFREMAALGMPVGVRVVDDLLYGCAKTAALTTAMALWRAAVTARDAALRPRAHTAANYLWALCSAETPVRGARTLSVHRRFHWANVSPAELSRAAHEVVAWMGRAGVPVNSHVLVALLALHANHGMAAEAEDIFWRRIWGVVPPRAASMEATAISSVDGSFTASDSGNCRDSGNRSDSDTTSVSDTTRVSDTTSDSNSTSDSGKYSVSDTTSVSDSTSVSDTTKDYEKCIVSDTFVESDFSRASGRSRRDAHPSKATLPSGRRDTTNASDIASDETRPSGRSEATTVKGTEYQKHINSETSTLEAVTAPPFGHEMMLKMYDTQRDYASARRVYEHYVSVFVDPHTGVARARLPYEAWRALARTAALTNHHEAALATVREMRDAQGYTPHIADFRVLVMRFSQAGRADLCRALAHLCRPADTRSAGTPPAPQLASRSRAVVADLVEKERGVRAANTFVPWIERSRAVGVLLERTLGRDAPRVATADARPDV